MPDNLSRCFSGFFSGRFSGCLASLFSRRPAKPVDEVAHVCTAPRRIVHAAEMRLTCLAGRLLVTFENCADDIELAPGQSVQVPNDGLTLVEGIGPSRMRLTGPRKPDCRPGLPSPLFARTLR